MNLLNVQQSISSARNTLEKCDKFICEAENALKEENIDIYERKLLSSIFQLENTLMRLRSMANANYSNKAPLLYEKMLNKIATSIYHISMDFDGNVMHMQLPCLLPHYKENNKNIVTEPLNQFLRDYVSKNELHKYEKVFFIVINHVSADTHDFLVRDNDNYEYKQLVNTLAFWFLEDDNTQYCHMISMTEKSENDYTEVFIVPVTEFMDWYKKHQFNKSQKNY